MGKNSRIWEQWEDDRIMNSEEPSKVLSELLDRSVHAIEARRSKLRRMYFMSPEEQQQIYDLTKARLEKSKDIQLKLEELTTGHDFCPQQLLILKTALRDSLDIRPIINENYTPSQLRELYLCLKSGIDISWATPNYDAKQIVEFRLGLEHKVNISWYTNPAFSCEAMRQIRYGLENNLEIQYYASTAYNCLQMQQLREALKEHLPIWKIASPAYSAEQMKVLRKAIKNGVDITSFANPKLSPTQMNAQHKALFDKFRAVYPTARHIIKSSGVSLKDLDEKGAPFVIHCKLHVHAEELLEKLKELGYTWEHLNMRNGSFGGMYFYCNPKEKTLYSNQNKPKDGSQITYLSLEDNNSEINEEEEWISCSQDTPKRVGLYVCLERNKGTREIQERMLELCRDESGKLYFLTEGTVIAWRPHVSREEMPYHFKKAKEEPSEEPSVLPLTPLTI